MFNCHWQKQRSSSAFMWSHNLCKGSCATPLISVLKKGGFLKEREHSYVEILTDHPSADDLFVEGTLSCLDRPDRNTPPTTYASLLRSFGIARALSDGRQVHHYIVKHGHEQNTYLGNLVVQMYVRCMDLDSAHFCFDRMQDRNVFTWNFLIGAYDGIGHYKEVLLLFEQMQVENIIPDKVTFVCILSAYANSQAAIIQGKQLHTRILYMGLDLNFIVATALMNMYGKCNDLELAWSMFESMRERDLVSWNALIAAYAQQGEDKEAFHIFERLHQETFLPDKVTYVNILSAFARPTALTYGKQIHASLHCEQVEMNVVVATALANMYGKCSSLKHARRLFNQMPVRNVVTWNAMLTVYAQHEHGKEALHLFHQMKQEGVATNKVTFVSVLDACASEGSLDEGRTVHALMTTYAFDSDVIVGTALVNMYNKCSSLQDGQRVFDLLPERNVISWNVMMTGFVHNGHGKEALQLFDQMQQEKVMLDELTASVVLSACALVASLARGKGMHAYVLRNGFELDVVVANAILNMYGKCGCVDDAQNMFDKMPERSLVSWNSMIALHAQHGNGKEVFKLLFEMQWRGTVPNETTFTSFLSVCSHVGLVSECIGFWVSMIQDHNILPTVDHFDCMVDMLGRTGQLNEAECLINKMPVQPSALSWTTLLSACRSSADVVRGQSAAKASVELDTSDTVTYITLSNIYAACGMKDNTLKLMDCLLTEDLKLLRLTSMKMEADYT